MILLEQERKRCISQCDLKGHKLFVELKMQTSSHSLHNSTKMSIEWIIILIILPNNVNCKKYKQFGSYACCGVRYQFYTKKGCFIKISIINVRRFGARVYKYCHTQQVINHVTFTFVVCIIIIEL